jgi:integrase
MAPLEPGTREGSTGIPRWCILSLFARPATDPGYSSNKKPGRPITKLNGPHDRICDKIGIQFVLYDLRHTFATRMIEAGVGEFALAAILGHSSTRVLYRYVHPTQQYQNAAMTAYDALNEAREKKTVQ